LSDQFKEPLALPATVPEVVPFECCASSDPPALPEALWPPAATV
jgi:hypothetical protein